jgi:hypothetical protein
LLRPLTTVSFIVWPILFGVLFFGFEFLKIVWLMSIFALFGVIVLPPLLGFLLVTANVAKGIYGSELLFNSARCDVTAHSAPDSISNVAINSVPPNAQSTTRLVHRLYDNPHCASLVAEWV